MRTRTHARTSLAEPRLLEKVWLREAMHARAPTHTTSATPEVRTYAYIAKARPKPTRRLTLRRSASIVQ